MEQKKWNRNDRRPPLHRAQEPSEAAENMLEGRNAVQEALAAGRPIDKLYIAAGETDRILFGAHEVGGLKVLTATLPNADAAKLRQMGDLLRDKAANVVAVLATVTGEKITFLAVCGKEAVAQGVKAGDIIKQVCAIAGGSGGGKSDSAMGGGKDLVMLDNALAMVDNFVSMKLGL